MTQLNLFNQEEQPGNTSEAVTEPRNNPAVTRANNATNNLARVTAKIEAANEAKEAAQTIKSPETVTEAFDLASTHYRDEISLSQFMANYETLKRSKKVVIEQLNSYTIPKLKNILARTGSFVSLGEKKADYINKISDSLESFFVLGSVSYDPFKSNYEEAKAKKINATTQADLDKFFKERAEAQALKDKAQSNPETLEEFRMFIDKNGEDALSSDQKAKREQLLADVNLKRQGQEEERKAEVSKVEIQNAEFKLHSTKHSKTGADIYTVIMTKRVETETFIKLRGKAKQLGGYYSKFSSKYANPPILPGFNFETQEAAEKFMGLTEESASSHEETQERKEAVKLSAADRLKDMAQGIKEKAEDSLSQERVTNTHRQARFAGNAETKARNEIEFADKLVLIAEGLESGTVKYLGGLRNGKQLEQLDSLIRGSYYRRMRALKQQDHNESPEPITDIEHVAYPFPGFSLSVLETVFLRHEDTPGMKLAVSKIIKRARELAGPDDLTVYFTGKYMIDLLRSTARKLTDKWEKERILDEVRNYDRLQSMGLTDLPTLKTALRELIGLGKDAGISDKEKAALEMKAIEREFIGMKIPGFFPTPEGLAGDAIDKVRIYDGDIIGEPSAGLGHIAQLIRERYPNNELKVLETQNSLVEVLEKKGFNVIGRDFLQCTEQFDVIIMNPPFENHQDIEHVRHAYSLLKPGGRLSAIMAGNKHENSSQSIIQEFMGLVADRGYMEQNEAGAFKSAFRTTGVSTVTVYLEKPSE